MKPELEDTIKEAKFYKTSFTSVAASVDGSHDMPPVLHFYRDGRLVAAILCNEVDRDLGCKWAYYGAGGFSADAVVHVQDAYTSRKHDYKTKEEALALEPGALQKMVEEGKRDEEGIFDALVLVHTDRSTLESVGVELVYTVIDGEITWLDQREMPGIEGRLVRANVVGFKQQTGRERMLQMQARPDWNEIYDGEPGDEMLHTDLGFVRSVMFLGAEECTVVYQGAGDDRQQQIVDDSIEHARGEIADGTMADRIAKAAAEYFGGQHGD